MQTFLFTHDDLDGLGCAVMAHVLWPNSVTVHWRGDYNGIDEAIENILGQIKDTPLPMRIVIGDITPSVKMCKKLDTFSKNNNEVLLFDHEESFKKDIEKFDWAVIDPSVCGTKLMYKYACQIDADIAETEADDGPLARFVNTIDAYDMWRLESPLRPRSEDMQRLFVFYGFDACMDYIRGDGLSVLDFDFEFDLEEHKQDLVVVPLREQEERIVRSRIWRQCKDDDNFAIHMDYRTEQKFCIIHAQSHVSQTCHAVLDHYPEIDFVVCVNTGRDICDLRSREGGVDVGKIAKQFGGGGRQTTAGFRWNARSDADEQLHPRIFEAARNI